METFLITSYFDPYGDKKSERKVFKRCYFYSNKTKDEIIDIIKIINEKRDYYHQLSVSFKNYKKVKDFDIINVNLL